MRLAPCLDLITDCWRVTGYGTSLNFQKPSRERLRLNGQCKTWREKNGEMCIRYAFGPVFVTFEMEGNKICFKPVYHPRLPSTASNYSPTI